MLTLLQSIFIDILTPPFFWARRPSWAQNEKSYEIYMRKSLAADRSPGADSGLENFSYDETHIKEWQIPKDLDQGLKPRQKASRRQTSWSLLVMIAKTKSSSNGSAASIPHDCGLWYRKPHHTLLPLLNILIRLYRYQPRIRPARRSRFAASMPFRRATSRTAADSIPATYNEEREKLDSAKRLAHPE